MSTVTTVLVILLAIGFVILLLLAITAAILVLKILRNIRRITRKAEQTTDSFADIGLMIGKRIAPVALSAAIAAALRRLKSKKE